MLLNLNENGLFCEQANVYIDPIRKVKNAILTHAHSDHARSGMENYLAHKTNNQVLKSRIGANISLQLLDYNEIIDINGVKISLHPAGHIPGSSQIRLSYKSEIWVVAGDYKLNDDQLSTKFETVSCTHFISESTFGLPIFNWKPEKEVFHELNEYWFNCSQNQEILVVAAYSLGKAQRIIKNLNRDIGTIYCHSAICEMNLALESQGLTFGNWTRLDLNKIKELPKNSVIVCPPNAIGALRDKNIQYLNYVSCSGWMALRGTKNWGNFDAGFVLSDHADWNELETACLNTGAENIFVTHGYVEVFSRFMQEKHPKLNVKPLKILEWGE